MAHRWTTEEKQIKIEELLNLYKRQNKTIGEVGKILGIAESTVFDRMKRLNITSDPEKKLNYCNRRHNIMIPKAFSVKLAEFIGIMLGDGHISPTQIMVSIGFRDEKYLEHVSSLMKELFGVNPKYIERTDKNVYVIYLGSVPLVKFFKNMGLVSNKVQQQVDVPNWILSDSKYSKAFLRGFFDTDGSIYKLRFGVQMAFSNRSIPLLKSTRKILLDSNYHPSKISSWKVYLTRKLDLCRYVKEIGFGNKKHFKKAQKFGILKTING